MAVDPRNFLFNSNYQIDRISGFYQGSVTVGSGGNAFPSIPHGLSYIPLYLLKWSTEPSFSTSYDEIGVSFNFLSCNARTDTTNINISALNLTGATVTFYFRVLYFMPPDINLDNAGTSYGLDILQFNTGYNYAKIINEGVLNAGSGTIDHNLGYFPQVEVWYLRTDGQMVHVVEADQSNFASVPRAVITPSSLILLNGNSPTTASKWFYRIYADET